MTTRKRYLLVAVLILVTAGYVNFHQDIRVPLNKPFGYFPRKIGAWDEIEQGVLSDQVLQILKPTDYLSRLYVSGEGKRIHLYVGYHGGGKDGGEIHSPRHCLPGTGWHAVSSVPCTVDTGSGPVTIVRAVYQKGDHRELFLYWFQVGNRTLVSEISLKYAQVVNSMLHRRRDATFVRISLPIDPDEQEAFRVGSGFVRDIHPLVLEFLPL